MPDILGIIESVGQSIGNQIGSTIGGILSYLGNAVEKNVIQPVSTDVSSVLNSVGTSLDHLANTAYSGFTTTLNAVGNGIDNVVYSAEQGFNSALNSVEQGIVNAEQQVVGVFNEVVGGIERGFSAVESGVASALTTVGDAFKEGVTALGDELGKVITNVIEPIGKVIEQIPSDIATIADKIGKTVEAWYQDFAAWSKQENAKGQLELNAVGNAIEKIANPGNILQFGKSFVGYLDQEFKALTGLEAADVDPASIARLYGVLELFNVIGLLMEFVPSDAFIVQGILTEIQNAALIGAYRNLRQAGNAGTPNEILPIGELVAGKFKGMVTEDTYYGELAKHGINKENADRLYAIGREFLGAGELVAAYRRGYIASKDSLYAMAQKVRVLPEQVDSLLQLYDKLIGVGEAVNLWRRDVLPEGWKDFFDDAKREGWTEERIAALKSASYELPPLELFHRFARQHVDDQATVDKYQYDYLISDEYLTLAKARGYDEQTAKRIWRAGWAIPPFFITEGLYRTGKMNEDTFRYFLTQEGYTPPVQDLLIEQLKPALTQTDIKEAYKYQVITGDEIVTKLVAIGTPQDVAEELATIWKASVKLASPLDQTGAQANAAKVKEDTQALIIKAYKDKLLTKDAATARLKAINVDPSTADLQLSIADYDANQQTIKDTFAELKNEVAAKAITIPDALAVLGQLGANADQQLLYQAELERVGSSKPKSPTLAEFTTWYKKTVINLAEYGQALAMLGYADVWIPFFMLEAGAAPKDVEALGYQLTDVLQS